MSEKNQIWIPPQIVLTKSIINISWFKDSIENKGFANPQNILFKDDDEFNKDALLVSILTDWLFHGLLSATLNAETDSFEIPDDILYCLKMGAAWTLTHSKRTRHFNDQIKYNINKNLSGSSTSIEAWDPEQFWDMLPIPAKTYFSATKLLGIIWDEKNIPKLLRENRPDFYLLKKEFIIFQNEIYDKLNNIKIPEVIPLKIQNLNLDGNAKKEFSLEEQGEYANSPVALQKLNSEIKNLQDQIDNVEKLTFKGRVNAFVDLINILDPKKGDVWYVITEDKYYVWNGEQQWIHINIGNQNLEEYQKKLIFRDITTSPDNLDPIDGRFHFKDFQNVLVNGKNYIFVVLDQTEEGGLLQLTQEANAILAVAPNDLIKIKRQKRNNIWNAWFDLNERDDIDHGELLFEGKLNRETEIEMLKEFTNFDYVILFAKTTYFNGRDSFREVLKQDTKKVANNITPLLFDYLTGGLYQIYQFWISIGIPFSANTLKIFEFRQSLTDRAMNPTPSTDATIETFTWHLRGYKLKK